MVTWYNMGVCDPEQSQSINPSLQGDPEPWQLELSEGSGGRRAGGVGSVTSGQVCPDTRASV